MKKTPLSDCVWYERSRLIDWNVEGIDRMRVKLCVEKPLSFVPTFIDNSLAWSVARFPRNQSIHKGPDKAQSTSRRISQSPKHYMIFKT